MIGQPNWFTRRKWAGWGLFPITWQGWLYVAVFVTIIFGTQFISNNQNVRMIALFIVAAILILDTIDIMFRMKKDERETLHEALAERNALWTIIFALAAGVAYQAARSVLNSSDVWIDPVIIIAIIAGLIAKAATNFYLDRKN